MEILIVIILNISGLMWCYTQQSDKVTDLIYALSFLLLTAVAWLSSADSLAHHLVFGMVALWSIRLGGYLFTRIHAMGKDDRFDKMRTSFRKIAGFWGLQTISILILAVPILILFRKSGISTHPLHYIGATVWLLGWLIESIADQQKFNFKTKPANKGQFIQTGLWKIVQHPNYLGEILCWLGVFLVASPSLIGWEWLAIISPLWITILLVFISGIPLLQRKAKKKYGHLPAFQKYQENTALLIPYIY